MLLLPFGIGVHRMLATFGQTHVRDHVSGYCVKPGFLCYRIFSPIGVAAECVQVFYVSLLSYN